MTAALPRIVEFLRAAHKAAAHKAAAHEFGSYVIAVDTLPRVTTIEAGAVGVGIASAAKIAVKQLPHTHVSALPALRLSILSLSDVLQQEMNARAVLPYHQRD